MKIRSTILDMQNTEAGFVALVSAVVISVLLLVLVIALSYSGYFARFNELDTEFKKQSLAYAEACADIAIAEIAKDATFSVPAGGRTYQVDPLNPDTCLINSINGSYTIKTSGVFKRASSNILLTVTRTTGASGTVTINCWKEVPDFTGAACP